MKARYRFDDPVRDIAQDEIDRELERLKPLLDQGGYIPHLDHLVPPDIPYAHYCECREKKRKLIGKE
jgi:uroporphyrinogen decarboxylase